MAAPGGDLDALETALLGAPCTLDRDAVSAAAGVPEPEARAFWMALGFPEVAAGERAFTELDADALRTVLELSRVAAVPPDTLLVLARAMGQGLARLAEAQVDAFRGQAADLTLEQATERVLSTAPQVLPRLERLVVHVWRRQFAAATARALVASRQDGQPVLAVGFVDLVGFTRATRSWDAATLERTLERFERDTALRVAAAGGRVVKTLGDEVLYVTDDPLAAVEVALDTVASHESDEELPQVRAGLALGAVLVRLGDVFGGPVNLASRLTDQARPGTVLVDGTLADALAGDASYDLKTLRRRSVRGYRHLVPHLVRRTSVRP
ncbi:MAG: adenylate/guanylate cyclase [Frankiales bacterium]|jgi:adenylate cyclase|nr:adenylate/guanylate cyclase [Frankiales bacterium]